MTTSKLQTGMTLEELIRERELALDELHKAQDLLRIRETEILYKLVERGDTNFFKVDWKKVERAASTGTL